MTSRSRKSAAASVPLVYGTRDVAALLNCSRSFVYKAIKSGELRSFMRGGCRVISQAAIDDYIARMEATTGEITPEASADARILRSRRDPEESAVQEVNDGL